MLGSALSLLPHALVQQREACFRVEDGGITAGGEECPVLVARVSWHPILARGLAPASHPHGTGPRKAAPALAAAHHIMRISNANQR